MGILDAIVCLAAILISQTAKPFRKLPVMSYRWGMYLGIMTAWAAVLWTVSCIDQVRSGSLKGGSALGGIALLCAAASLGILRRRRFGILLFGLLNVTVILMTPVLEPMQGQPLLLIVRSKPVSVSELATQIKVVPTALRLVISACYLSFTWGYFKDRWGLMARTSEGL
jgi:hypothetical protein